MAKDRTLYVCQACGATHPKWQGKCEVCGEWNTLQEEAPAPRPSGPAAKAGGGRRVEFVGLEGTAAPPPRVPTGSAELDRVLGGGIVPASAVLVGGDPGIGKSTILLQAAARIAAAGRRVLYVSGEEAVEQVRLRARRLGLEGAPLALAAATALRDIAASLDRESDAALVVIDSIQTMWLDALDSAPGTVAQVRACAAELIRLAKTRGFALILVGHVTKEGTLAGPRVLEHMVDATLYFEGDRGHQFRILRAVKNRFGATDEIGVFEMTDRGLVEVANPSALFLAERRGNVSGSAVFAGVEGTRPVLVEVQALLAPSAGGSPRRQWSAGTPGGCPCCWRCWSRAAASRSAPTTSTSTSRAASASPSPRPTSLSRRRWCPRPPTGPRTPRRSISARSACPGRSGRWRRRRRGFGRRRSSASPPPCCRGAWRAGGGPRRRWTVCA
jgi:DNA repair protein RadA/Sms